MKLGLGLGLGLGFNPIREPSVNGLRDTVRDMYVGVRMEHWTMERWNMEHGGLDHVALGYGVLDQSL